MRRFLVASAVAALTLAGGLTVDAHTGVAPHLTYTHTPSGKMRSDCVHQLASGHTVAESTGEGWMDVMDAEGNYVRTLPKCANQASFPLFDPSTPNRHARQQQQQQPAKTILTEEEFRATKPKQDDPFPPDYDGWEAYTAWHYPSGITLFNGNFSVPDTPASQPDVLYLFTGLQNVDWIPVRDPEVPGFDIIQPVLQYPADGGLYWSVKSWYVTLDDGAIETTEVPMTVGDNVYGVMEQTQSNGTWFIGSTASSTGQTTTLTVSRARLAGQFWAYNTLECYGCVDCTTYPIQPCKFSELVLQNGSEDLNPVWLLNPKPNPSLKCHETIDILDASAQNVIFQ